VCQVGDLGYASELGNYAEYSGAPNEEEVLQYARVVLDVRIEEKTLSSMFCSLVLPITHNILDMCSVPPPILMVVRELSSLEEV
jgi:hypothetical protein